MSDKQELVIPEDLQNWYNIARRERTSDIKHVYGAEDCIVLIERIARAEARVRELKAENERMKAPVNDEEWKAVPKLMKGHRNYSSRDELDAIIASRAKVEED